MDRPIFIYTCSALTIVLPIIFRLINRKLTWTSILCAITIELIMYWDHFSYYESRGLTIYATIIQVVIMVIITIILNLIGKKVNK